MIVRFTIKGLSKISILIKDILLTGFELFFPLCGVGMKEKGSYIRKKRIFFTNGISFLHQIIVMINNV